MKVSAIICEYNPMHNGHAYHIARTRMQTGCDAVICLMSGNFVQRGEFAFYEKSVRAQAAIAGGANLVLELPALLTLQSAERYASNAVETLDALQCVDFLSFGAECEDIEKLTQIAHLLADEPAEFKELLKEQLANGISFPLARCRAIEALLGEEASQILQHPNNILAVEYLKALKRQNSAMNPIVIKRTGAGHDSDETSGEFASASKLRELLRGGKQAEVRGYIPEQCATIYEASAYSDPEVLDPAIMAELYRMSAEELKEIADVAEGLENKIRTAAFSAENCQALIEQVKSKRYPLSRIRRLILNAYLKIKKSDLDISPQYIKVLAFDEVGQALLNRCKKTTSLPLSKNRNQVKGLPDAEALWDRELIFDRIYSLTLKNK